ncbi:restriction endonuclease subunit S [Streptococcus sp. 4477]|uniref:restriction endonuclease subunit S n=1 Tax=Streptococcus sp. 4477 TaxID=2582686 RepID=UPI001562213F|nr:restriction endonuclease subunit S [Streptococcus sp. 4477]
MTKQPSYRFGGYTEAWAEKKLGEVNDVRDGTHDSPKYVQDGYPLVTSKNLTSEGLDFSDISFISEVDYISINKRSKVEIGDIIFGMIGTIGNPVLLKKDGFAIKNVALLKKDGFIDNSFLIQLLQSSSFIKYISLENAGGTQKFLGLSQIRNFQLFSPSLPEQTAIGSFFQDIDQLISLQQRKLEVLKEQKKTYLKLLFPAKGQTKPALRFAGFEDEWKEVKLGEVATITMGQSPNSENYTDNPNDYILVQGNADMKNGRVFPRVWTTQITKQAKQGNLILSVRAPVGDIGKTDYDVVLGRGVASIDGNEFLYQVLSQMKQNGYWSKLSTGSTFESINSNDIKSAIISLPSLPEQEVIGSFFQDLDKAIAKQEEKVNQLKESKQTLLRKMFI